MSTFTRNDEQAFRREVREYLQNSIPQDIMQKSEQGRALSKEEVLTWQRMLLEKGWGAPHWDPKWGGTDWCLAQQLAFQEELINVDAPEVLGFNARMLGPIIQAYGTEKQKEDFLPKTLNMDYWWCQGYSEPSAGSDLASLQTRAVRDGDEYVVNGSKLWNSYGQYADWMFCLVRTSNEGKKQQGISFLLIDMNTPGITVTPDRHFFGRHHFNQVFLEDVRVPIENRIGEENTGWTIAKALLEHERLIAPQKANRRLRRLLKMARTQTLRGKPIIEHGHVRHRIAELATEVRALNYSAMRCVANLVNTGQIGAISSILKLKGVALFQRIDEVTVDIMGSDAIVAEREFENADLLGLNPEARNVLESRYYSRGPAISGGSNEVQRTVIAKRILELG